LTHHVVLGWAEIERDAEALARQLRAAGHWTGIVAVARGGLVPAALLAYHLAVRQMDILVIETYRDETLGKPIVRRVPQVGGAGAGWLIVDDLVDQGATMRVARDLLPAARVAVLYAKPRARPLAHYVARDYAQEAWLVLPWERPDVPA
jgi:xanthine phosphoribosyltransferase